MREEEEGGRGGEGGRGEGERGEGEWERDLSFFFPFFFLSF